MVYPQRFILEKVACPASKEFYSKPKMPKLKTRDVSGI
jgi:hypothetical protein